MADLYSKCHECGTWVNWQDEIIIADWTFNGLRLAFCPECAHKFTRMALDAFNGRSEAGKRRDVEYVREHCAWHLKSGNKIWKRGVGNHCSPHFRVAAERSL